MKATIAPGPEQKPRRSWLSCNHSYTLFYCHLETFRSSLSPSPHLLQLAALSSQGEFLRPVIPQDVTKYLGRSKLWDDLLEQDCDVAANFANFAADVNCGAEGSVRLLT